MRGKAEGGEQRVHRECRHLGFDAEVRRDVQGAKGDEGVEGVHEVLDRIGDELALALGGDVVDGPNERACK